LKKILIIYPHFPPSNLTGVHRPRLFANHLQSLGWEPVVLTVNEKHYEEALDWNLVSLLPKGLRIEKVSAYKITQPRLIGDIGLRAFFQLRRRALQLLQSEHFDFVYIPIPSFYLGLLGPYLHKKTGVKYGIDYIDPWVHRFPGSGKIFSRHWFSTKIAGWLEPKAVKYASLITGVAEGYYQGVIDRNPTIVKQCIFGAMPYGGEINDYTAIESLQLSSYLFNNNGKLKIVYAGAMLPKAYTLLDSFFEFIKNHLDDFQQIEFYFIGTGKNTRDPNGYNIRDTSVKHSLWQTIIFEHPMRIPYLDVLVHLHHADGVFILGSTESHYTPSKLYQAVLSKKPVFSILHMQSSAYEIIQKTGIGVVTGFQNESEVPELKNQFNEPWKKYVQLLSQFEPDKINTEAFNQYSAWNTTKVLAKLLDEATS